jgi:hypothetical protein
LRTGLITNEGREWDQSGEEYRKRKILAVVAKQEAEQLKADQRLHREDP